MLTEERYTQPAGDMPDFGSEERLRLGTQIWKRAHRESCWGRRPECQGTSPKKAGKGLGNEEAMKGTLCTKARESVFRGQWTMVLSREKRWRESNREAYNHKGCTLGLEESSFCG